MAEPVDTARVERRRKLRFADIDELLAELDRIMEAERAGRLRRTGNWTVGQTFGHLAAWIDFAYEGYPFKTPWLIRMLIRPRIPGYIRDGLPAGVHIPKAPRGTYGIEPLSTEEGLRRLRAALERLKGEPARHDSPGFGHVSDEDRVALNLRHAELHLSFLHPE